MNCNVKITAVGTADGLEVSIHGGSVGMMTAAELIVARVLMAVADDEENLAGLKRRPRRKPKKKLQSTS